MAYVVRTVPGGVTAAKSAPGKADAFTQEQAEADCAVRNAEAEKLGIKGRYEVVDV